LRNGSSVPAAVDLAQHPDGFCGEQRAAGSLIAAQLKRYLGWIGVEIQNLECSNSDAIYTPSRTAVAKSNDFLMPPSN
jgi:hypothetical protein